jgi:4-amino-4-deoxychorismate lyase
MYPLFESLCIQDGQLLHTQWHQLRFEKACQNFFGKTPTFDLLESIDIPEEFCRGTAKLKIQYNENKRTLDFQHYQMQGIQSLRLVHANTLYYTHKYSNREKLEALFTQRGNCDDVLIVRRGRITDSSYANVVFFDGKDWWTPHLPLLEGTCRARLLAQGDIKEDSLGVDDLKKFQGLKLINALRDMNQPMIPINRLVY